MAVLVVVVALGDALWRELGGDDSPAGFDRRRHRRATGATPTPPRRWRGPGPVPTWRRAQRPAPGAGPEALRGIILECAGDGSQVDVAPAVAGRPVLLNLWAYWCGPCADELPAMAEYQRGSGRAVTVLTVHQDENETAALLRLAELGVHLPTLQDGRRRIAAALKVPNVMPATVVLRPDGSVAEILPRSFANADEIAAAVDPQSENS